MIASSMTFETFRPADPLVARHVDYYYLDRKPRNGETAYDCFPHFNTTMSLYSSHRMPRAGKIFFDPLAPPLQIFTPLREKVLRVQQSGSVHRVVIVFRVLGVQHFWRNVRFAEYQTEYPFFSAEELECIFSTENPALLTEQLDHYLARRFVSRPADLVKQIICYVFDHLDDFSVGEMAFAFGVSRRHLHRVFKDTIGVSIKRFQEIVVLRGCIDRKLLGNENASLTQLAYTANYSDQSHMIRAFRKFTQRAPLQFFNKGQLLGQAGTFWHVL